MRLKTEQEIKIIGEGGHILATILDDLLRMLKPGLGTKDLEDAALEMMSKAGAEPSFKGYKANKKDKPFPTALCVSINDEVVHAAALPNKEIKEGDVVSIDIGMKYKGLYTDMAKTAAVGQVSEEVKKLITVTKHSLDKAIKIIKPGLSLYDLGKTIQDYVEAEGFSVVRQLVGHGVGHAVHEQPQIPNYAVDNNRNEKLEAGMVIAVEPMVNAGKWEIEVAKDGWAIKTVDGKLSAHFEHTIAVTKNGCIVLTK
jgi:methionyl aminopeptidase